MNTYLKEIKRSMNFISKKKNTIFLGQSVKYPGSSIYNSLVDVDQKKKIELPVFEDVQMGISIGMALEGFTTVTCFPRFDFLVLAFNQLINHADKIDYLTNNDFNSKIIIRTIVGANKPLDAGPQHTQDHTEGLRKILKNIRIIKLKKSNQIFNLYKKSFYDKKNKVFLFIEEGNKYL